jgi:hypothetical protein
LDQRHAFFEYEQQYLLYLWYMLEKHDLLGCSLQRLDDGVSAGDGGRSVPSIDVGSVTTASASASVATDGDLDKNPTTELKRLSETILEMTKMEAREQEKNHIVESVHREKTHLRKLKDDIRELEQKCHENRNDSTSLNFYSKQLQDVQAEFAELQAELNSLVHSSTLDNPTPQRRGGTPASAVIGRSSSNISSPDFDNRD